MAISSIGVGSGLPIEQLLEDLRKSENQPLVQIQSQQVSAETRLSAYSTLKGSIEALNNAAKALGKTDAFGALKASTPGDLFTATVTNKAIAGKYNIQVGQLATSHTQVAATGQADRTAGITNAPSGNGSGGTLSVTLDNGEPAKTLEISGKDGAAPSLDDIVAAINGDPSLGISATLINDGSDQPHRLLITSNETGSKASVTDLSFTATDGDSAVNDLLSSMTKEVGKNAEIQINGIPITSQSNQVEGAIEGVTLSLLKTGDSPTTTSSLAVTRDDSVTDKAIKTFVEAYNSLHNTIKSLTSYDIDAQRSSALTGDSMARSMQNQVRNALNAVVDGGAVKGLWDLGITSHPTSGVLEIDNDKLSAALKNDMGSVAKLFTGENGISNQMNKVSDSFTSSDNGLIKTAQEGINRNIENLKKQYTATSERIDAKMEAYRKQFSGLDVMMSQMNGISNYLTQQLSMLGNIGKE